MKTVAFAPPVTNIGTAALFWTLLEQLREQGHSFKPHWTSEWQPPEPAWPAGDDVVEIFDERAARTYDAVIFFMGPSWLDVNRVVRWRQAFLLAGGRPEAWCSVLIQRGMPGADDISSVEKELRFLPLALSYAPETWLKAQQQGRAVDRSSVGLIAADLAAFLEQCPAHEAPSADEQAWSSFEKAVAHKVAEQSALGHEEPAAWLVERAVSDEILESGLKLSPEQLQALRERITDQVTGLGRLGPFMRDAAVSEIVVNGTTSLFIERGGALEKDPAPLKNNEIQLIVDRMAAFAGRRLDAAHPHCDIRLRDGSRVNIVLPPIAVDGPYITVRRFHPAIGALEDLVARGTLNGEQGRRLRAAVEERKNIVIAGNTGSGKTTLLNILSSFIAAGERIVTIEDAAELKLQNPHVVRLEARPANAEGVGAVSIQDLVVNALRMRPDRLIVGECRGAEAIPMLQAMNTGHDGSMTTLHANSAEEALERLEAMVLIGAPRWPIDVVRRQIASAIDVIVYLKREGGRRTLTQIAAVTCQKGELALAVL